MQEFSDLIGQTIKEIQVFGDVVVRFILSDGSKYLMYHDQQCCENVYLEDVCGDWADVVGRPIMMAEEVRDADRPSLGDPDSYTWTFYKLGTNRGSVTLRWYGTSNGYYSESASFRIEDTWNCLREDERPTETYTADDKWRRSTICLPLSEETH